MATGNRLVASRGARIVVLCVAVFCALNYILHNLGFVFFGREFADLVLPNGLQLEVNRMSVTPRYAQSADAYASFLVVTLFQVVMSAALFLALFIRRILVALKLMPKLELERVQYLVWVFLWFGVFIIFIGLDNFSIIFNESTRLGGKPIWFDTLILSLQMLMMLSILLGFLLFPAAINHNVKYGGRNTNTPE